MRGLDVTEEDFTRILASPRRPRNVDRMIAITRARLEGTAYKKIGEKHRITGGRASEIVAKTERLAREMRKLTVLGQLTKDDAARFMELSARSVSAIRRLGIDTIGQLVECLKNEGVIVDYEGRRRNFYNQLNFGRHSQKEVVDWLVDNGFLDPNDPIASQFWPKPQAARRGPALDLRTPDPRFDPRGIVYINGYRFVGDPDWKIAQASAA